MNTRRKHLGVATLDGMIYAVGGRDESRELNSAERYIGSMVCLTQTWAVKAPLLYLALL